MTNYPTLTIKASELNSTHVLVGDCDGLSAVFNVYPSNIMPGCVAIETEHGTLYLEADIDVNVYAAHEPW
jgi:hypothetical protein